MRQTVPQHSFLWENICWIKFIYQIVLQEHDMKNSNSSFGADKTPVKREFIDENRV